jgi:putative ABC transport system permease protein
MFALSLKMSLARKGRLVLTSLAIILGTGFLSGTFIFSDTLSRTFDRLFTDVFRDVDAYVRSTNFIEVPFGGEQRAGTPIEALDTVLSVPGVKDATGDIQAFARIIAKDGKPLGSDNGPPTFGGIATASEAGLWTVEEGRLPKGPTEMVMDEASVKNGDFVIGDTVRVNAQSGSREFTLVGIANYGDISSPGGATFALFDQATASEFLLRPGLVDAFLVQGDGSLSQEELAAGISAALEPSLRLETLTGLQIAEETKNQIGAVVGFLSTFLTIFSLIALGIGCFVIYNVFSITTAQRLRENALLRAIGASRRQVTTSVIVEAFIIGILGSVLGFIVGIGLSRGLSVLLAAFGVDIPTSGLAIRGERVAITILVGTIVTLASAVFPALRAGRVPPLAAMRDTAIERVGSRKIRFIIGGVIAAAGVASLVLAAAGVNDWLLGVGVVGVFTAVIIYGPLIAKPVALTLGAPLARRSVTGAMARQNAARNPRRTAGTVAPVLIGVALVTAFSAFAASVRSEIRSVIGDQFGGDYAISAPQNGFGGLPVSLSDEVAALPEVAQATGLGFATIELDGVGRFVQVINPATAKGLVDLNMVQGDQSTLSANGVIVSNNRFTTEGWRIGETLEMKFVDGTVMPLTIEGTFVPNGFFGSYVINREVFAGTPNSLFDSIIYVVMNGGVSEEDARAALLAVSEQRGLGALQSREEFIDAQANQINQILGLIYGLLALSIVIAVVGIVITLLLSVFERRREIGLLRAVGMTRTQVRLTVVGESVITSMFGAVVGVVLGIFVGLVLIGVLADDGIAAFSLPVGSTIVILLLAFVIGVIAAMYPARRATKVDIMQAIATT